MKSAEVLRSPNRAILNSFYNGEPPWTAKEAEENNILINFNDKQGANLLHQARNQYENAFSKQGQFFKITVPSCPKHLQKDYGVKITNHLNHFMRNSREYYYTQDCVWGGVVLHGVGAKVWWDEHGWRPDFVGIQDMLIPTDTNLTLNNLQYFAIRRPMRAGELFRRTIGKGQNMRKGWNLPLVKKLLSDFKDLNTNTGNYDWANNPEQMTELYKQNLSYYDGDSAPVIWMWDFFYKEETKEEAKSNGWYRVIILDKFCNPIASSTEEKTEFIFESETPYASKLDNFIHFQFGDGNNVPPFKYHSIRSLAWLIYDLVWTMNRLNCQFTQHVFEQMMILFRVTDPSDRDRLTKLVLQGIVGLIPEGLNIVTSQERYQVRTDLVQGLMANLKQRVSESSSQYTQSVDSGTQKERTKYEVQAILAQTSALMASMLGRAYRQEHFADVEIARRFAIKDSSDFDVKKFRTLCIEDGIPEQYLNSDRWEVEVEQVLGGGNRMLEMAEASELMNRVHMFDPGAQQEIKHDFVLAVTNNPKKAARLAPLDAPIKVSDSVQMAYAVFGGLMQGVEMEPKEGVNHIEQIETLLGLMAQVVERIKSTDEMGTQQEVIGLQSVAKYIGKHIVILSQNPDEKPRVKTYTDNLSGLMNEVRAFVQRQEEQSASEGAQQNPETLAKVQSIMAELQASLMAQQEKTRQEMTLKQQKHDQQLQIDREKSASQMQNEQGKALASVAIEGMKAAAKPEPAATED